MKSMITLKRWQQDHDSKGTLEYIDGIGGKN